MLNCLQKCGTWTLLSLFNIFCQLIMHFIFSEKVDDNLNWIKWSNYELKYEIPIHVGSQHTWKIHYSTKINSLYWKSEIFDSKLIMELIRVITCLLFSKCSLCCVFYAHDMYCIKKQGYLQISYVDIWCECMRMSVWACVCVCDEPVMIVCCTLCLPSNTCQQFQQSILAEFIKLIPHVSHFLLP